MAEFNISLTDLIFMKRLDQSEKRSRQTSCKREESRLKPLSEILARDCTPNCAGKKCTDDNGCGLPCGCPEGKICLSSGICTNQTCNEIGRASCRERV